MEIVEHLSCAGQLKENAVFWYRVLGTDCIVHHVADVLVISFLYHIYSDTNKSIHFVHELQAQKLVSCTNYNNNWATPKNYGSQLV